MSGPTIGPAPVRGTAVIPGGVLASVGVELGPDEAVLGSDVGVLGSEVVVLGSEIAVVSLEVLVVVLGPEVDGLSIGVVTLVTEVVVLDPEVFAFGSEIAVLGAEVFVLSAVKAVVLGPEICPIDEGDKEAVAPNKKKSPHDTQSKSMIKFTFYVTLKNCLILRRPWWSIKP